MKLADLLAGLVTFSHHDLQQAVTGLTLDSRVVQTGHAFIALAGSKQHGLEHAQQAIANGAIAIIYDPANGGDLLTTKLVTAIPLFAIDNLSLVLGQIAARFYGDPSSLLKVVGITGTNGKTSCSQFLSQVLDDCGIIGTLGWGEWGNLHKTLNTTPDALAIQHIFAQLLIIGKKAVAMEVSSHGLEQGRVNGVHFNGAVFTNISRDHLDYHGSMENYLQAKLALLKAPNLAFAVVNLDDAYSEQILAAIPKTVKVWGITCRENNALSPLVHELLTVVQVLNQLEGIQLTVQWHEQIQTVSIPLYGDFNVENVLCVLAVMLALEMDFLTAVKKLARLQAVAGRMERFGNSQQPLVFVDYAHTPDALDKVLSSVRKHCQHDLWVVFGCGGNRDTGKRGLMGACAERWADKVIVTDDNPRFEQSMAIIEAILSGCKKPEQIQVLPDREQAIFHAIHQAKQGDCIVIAGKGHEDYQEINGKTLPFSDSVCVQKALLRE